MIFDVAEADFETKVVERSRELPVVVDFWADWCGPCKQLGPVLEQAVRDRDGKIELAKIDVDQNKSISQAFGVQGIPAVKAFRDGKVAAEFTGALPPVQVAEFLDGLLPSAADALVASGDEVSLRAALDADPAHRDAAVGLAQILVKRGDDDEARDILARVATDFVASGLLARLDLLAIPNGASPELTSAVAALDAGDVESGLSTLQYAIRDATDEDRRDLIRRLMVGVFADLGPGDPIAAKHRRLLAATLN